MKAFQPFAFCLALIFMPVALCWWDYNNDNNNSNNNKLFIYKINQINCNCNTISSTNVFLQLMLLCHTSTGSQFTRWTRCFWATLYLVIQIRRIFSFSFILGVGLLNIWHQTFISGCSFPMLLWLQMVIIRINSTELLAACLTSTRFIHCLLCHL